MLLLERSSVCTAALLALLSAFDEALLLFFFDSCCLWKNVWGGGDKLNDYVKQVIRSDLRLDRLLGLWVYRYHLYARKPDKLVLEEP